jgi:hypothetical protein
MEQSNFWAIDSFEWVRECELTSPGEGQGVVAKFCIGRVVAAAIQSM